MDYKRWLKDYLLSNLSTENKCNQRNNLGIPSARRGSVMWERSSTWSVFNPSAYRRVLSAAFATTKNIGITKYALSSSSSTTPKSTWRDSHL
jgi:hypothetical protein